MLVTAGLPLASHYSEDLPAYFYDKKAGIPKPLGPSHLGR